MLRQLAKTRYTNRQIESAQNHTNWQIEMADFRTNWQIALCQDIGTLLAETDADYSMIAFLLLR